MTHPTYDSPILVTGAAGFVGYHTVQTLIAKGATKVIGVDNLNPYYDPALKQARLKELARHGETFHFVELDLADNKALQEVCERYAPANIIHLAAQAGVRYSLENPHAYTESNLIGFMNILEIARQRKIEHTVFASSSSVYGANQKLPYSEADVTDHPVSLYAATKKCNELLAFSYASMYGTPLTGLRFFTVYGPYGRPDMAYFKFTKSIMEGTPITIYNEGNMMRDFTYIDDIVAGILGTLENPPPVKTFGNTKAPAAIYNIGHNHPENLGVFIDLLEKHIGKKAIRKYEPLQVGDVLSTYADIDNLNRLTGYVPTTSLDAGLGKFVAWYKQHYGA